MHNHEAEFANEAFYLAFAQKDFAAMERLWASDGVVCLHPGWPALTDRASIIESWKSILTNPNQPPIDFYGVTSTRVAEGTIAVVCYEVVAGSTMVATNVFVAEEGAPKIALHQSGVCANPPDTAAPGDTTIN